MTYPPQPGQPYGQQPDPYGQGGQPQTGGFPQQYPGQQYPQGGYDQTGAYGQQPYPGYAQHQYPQNQQYGQGFGGSPPPRKSKTGLVIALAAAAVVLIAVGVTGFIAPGFFLSKDNTTASGSPEKVAQAIVDGINAHDKAALSALKCGDAASDIDQAINGVSAASNAKLGQVRKVSASEYKAAMTLRLNGTPGTANGTIATAGDKWCWKRVSGPIRSTRSSTPTSRFPTSSRSQSPESGSGEGAALVKNFVDKINAKDKTGATGLVCSGSENMTATYIDRAVSGSPQITAEVSGGENFITANIGGTFNGKEANGVVTANNTTGTFCVTGFVVY